MSIDYWLITKFMNVDRIVIIDQRLLSNAINEGFTFLRFSEIEFFL